MGGQQIMPTTESDALHISASSIFLACSRIALSSFGAPLFWARRELIERRRWLTESQFTDLLAIGQILPGANVLNLLVMFGHRCAGWKGALAAKAGFMGWPFFIVIGLGMTYERFAWLLAYSGFDGAGAANISKPALADRVRRARRHGWPCLISRRWCTSA